MAQIDTQAVALMLEKAHASAITVVEVNNMQDALAYALEICENKAPCRLLLGEDGPAEASERVIAAPDLSDADYEHLAAKAAEKGITLIRQGMRDRLAGIDLGITHAEMGIAETATSVVKSASEEVRLASMIAEIHLLILPRSRVVPTLDAAAPRLDALMKQDTPVYTAFISGPSRTADIERVLAIGVHGPLELHIALVEG